MCRRINNLIRVFVEHKAQIIGFVLQRFIGQVRSTSNIVIKKFVKKLSSVQKFLPRVSQE